MEKIRKIRKLRVSQARDDATILTDINLNFYCGYMQKQTQQLVRVDKFVWDGHEVKGTLTVFVDCPCGHNHMFRLKE